ncbi:hypothetical protein GCM10027093_11100 [Paraburkholderia jirisanensis]
MDPVRAGGDHVADFFTEARKIRGQDAGGDVKLRHELGRAGSEAGILPSHGRIGLVAIGMRAVAGVRFLKQNAKAARPPPSRCAASLANVLARAALS